MFVEKSSGKKDSPLYVDGMYNEVNPTPYMHGLEFHVCESLKTAQILGIPLRDMSTQGLEHLNHQQVNRIERNKKNFFLIT